MTHPKIQAYIDAEKAIKVAYEVSRKAEEAAEQAPLPKNKNLRPAIADDLTKIGQVVWYPHWDERKWAIVEEPGYYGDDYKAYTAHDGCRYGLRGAFVEIEK